MFPITFLKKSKFVHRNLRNLNFSGLKIVKYMKIAGKLDFTRKNGALKN